jgi:[histone H3]-lysine36 N-trimethyltransferase
VFCWSRERTFVHANLKHDSFTFLTTLTFHIDHIIMAHSSKPSPKAESVDDDTIEVKHEPSPSADRGLEMSLLRTGAMKDEHAVSASNSPSLLPSKLKSSRSSSSTSVKSRATSESSVDKKDVKGKVGGEISLKMESGQPPKLARSASQKATSRVAPLFDDLPDSTMEAKSSFSVIEACSYSNKFLGYTEHAMECDCSEEWGKR